MIGKVVTGCVAILSYHTATQDRGSECRDFGFISRIVTALIHIYRYIGGMTHIIAESIKHIGFNSSDVKSVADAERDRWVGLD